jgi:hypothetical protein
MLEICKVYGWTYQDFMGQPHWFNELAIERYIIDVKRASKAEPGV